MLSFLISKGNLSVVTDLSCLLNSMVVLMGLNGFNKACQCISHFISADGN